MSETPFPHRPRLADHALARRHVVDGDEIVVVHDTVSGSLIRMGPREWEIVACADGTREMSGVLLAAAARGAYRRASEARAVLDQLHEAGLLADGIEHPISPAPPADRPLDVLPGYSLTCDESGACCGMYGTVVFTPFEAARARAVLPDVLDGGARPDRVFMPERATGRDGALAVAQIDGRCAYLADGGRCSLHVAAGEDHKPRGCRTYPATFVDDGESLRVSVGVECPCVIASNGIPGGAPLVPPGARNALDLGPGARISVLPEIVAIASGRAAPRADFVAWSRRVAALAEAEAIGAGLDVPAALWSLGAALDHEGLSEDAARDAIRSPARPPVEDVEPWVHALEARAKARLASASAWRSERDRSRIASGWLADGAVAALAPGALASALGAGGFDRAEAFYLRAVLHGHQLADEIPVADGCRDRAVRLWIARLLPSVIPAGDPSHVHPITLVEAMMRGHGLKGYARDAIGAAIAG